MKREIKFRAWNEGKMIDLLAITPLALDANMNTQLALRNMGGLFLPFGGNIELMQYTGIKDKNGKEIYEGDIISESIYDIPAVYCGEEIFTIEWQGTGFVKVSKDNKLRKWYLAENLPPHETLNNLENIKVIGNIYENELLLK